MAKALWEWCRSAVSLFIVAKPPLFSWPMRRLEKKAEEILNEEGGGGRG